MTGQTVVNTQNIAMLCADGFTRSQIAAKLELSYPYVSRLAKAAGLIPPRQKYSGAETASSLRVQQMATLYKSGRTLKQIGDKYGITRERVRQILTKHLGFDASSGGQREAAKQKRARFEAKRNQKCIVRWGCSWEQYTALRAMQKPTRAYASQKRNAAVRGIPWELTLWQWWTIWSQSGHWDNRGRGRAFQMCRVGDQGPYSVDNVYIASGAVNIQDYWSEVKSGNRDRRKSVRSCSSSPEKSKAAAKAAADRYHKTPKYKLRLELRRQGLPKSQRDAIVAERFGSAAA